MHSMLTQPRGPVS
ncbi:hypothetical protein IEO21_04142 [Rhodonia placenta]|nr:hypothetical protein IEO21_04142 [Postia placenta]